MSSETVKKIGKRIKAIRQEKGLTQIEVADKAKLNSNYYSKIERGEINASPDAYGKIAKALKVTSADIFPF